jgi:hypothetical protein
VNSISARIAKELNVQPKSRFPILAARGWIAWTGLLRETELLLGRGQVLGKGRTHINFFSLRLKGGFPLPELYSAKGLQKLQSRAGENIVAMRPAIFE